jgi:hypothetical protein
MSSSRARNAMRVRLMAIVAASVLVGSGLGGYGAANAQDALRRISVKNGESVDLGTVYYVSNCRSIMVGLPDIEVLEGPSGVTISIREEPVLPRRQGCAAKVAGGTVVLTAKDVTEPAEAKLTYRVNYKTKDGPARPARPSWFRYFPITRPAL